MTRYQSDTINPFCYCCHTSHFWNSEFSSWCTKLVKIYCKRAFCVEQNRCHKSSSLSHAETQLWITLWRGHTHAFPRKTWLLENCSEKLKERKRKQLQCMLYLWNLHFQQKSLAFFFRNMELCSRIAIADVSTAQRSCFESALTAEANLCVWCSCRIRWNVTLAF